MNSSASSVYDLSVIAANVTRCFASALVIQLAQKAYRNRRTGGSSMNMRGTYAGAYFMNGPVLSSLRRTSKIPASPRVARNISFLLLQSTFGVPLSLDVSSVYPPPRERSPSWKFLANLVTRLRIYHQIGIHFLPAYSPTEAEFTNIWHLGAFTFAERIKHETFCFHCFLSEKEMAVED